jgi:hypothetical protein
VIKKKKTKKHFKEILMYMHCVNKYLTITYAIVVYKYVSNIANKTIIKLPILRMLLIIECLENARN